MTIRNHSNDADNSEESANDTGTILPTNTAAKYGKRAHRTAQRVQEEMLKHSSVVSRQKVDEVVRLGCDEILLGDLLGSGKFCHVTQVHRIDCHRDDATNSPQMRQRRELMTSISPQHKYAIKFLRSDLNPDKYCLGAAELVVEMNLLSSLKHPNLIGLHGVSKEGPLGFKNGNGYFFIIDRLHNTLNQRLAIWRDLESRQQHSLNQKTKLAMLLQRLQVGTDISSVLTYLHSQKILYRGIDPRNLAFNDAGKIVLFDLGLARELEDAKLTSDGINYELSGNKGSLPYMAPEVGMCQPYGTRADVYGMAVLLWQLCTLSSAPFPNLTTRNDYLERVVQNKERPALDSSWPETLRYLIKSSWMDDAAARPQMKQFHRSLQHEIDDLVEETATSSSNNATRPPEPVPMKRAPGAIGGPSVPFPMMVERQQQLRAAQQSHQHPHPHHHHDIQHGGLDENPIFLALLPAAPSLTPPSPVPSSPTSPAIRRHPRSPVRNAQTISAVLGTQPASIALTLGSSNHSISSLPSPPVNCTKMSRPNSGGNRATTARSRQQQFRKQDDVNLMTLEVLERVGQPVEDKTQTRRMPHEQQRRSSSWSIPTKSKMKMAEAAFKSIGGATRCSSDSSLEISTASLHLDEKIGPLPIRQEKKQPDRKQVEKKQPTEKRQTEKKLPEKNKSEKKKSKVVSPTQPKTSSFKRNSKPPSGFRRHQPDPVEQTESNKQEFRNSLLSALAEDKGQSRRRSQNRDRRTSRSRSRARSSSEVKQLPLVMLPPSNSVESILLTSKKCWPTRSSISDEDSTTMRRRSNRVNWCEEIDTKELEKEHKLKFLDRELQNAKLKLVEVPKGLLPHFSHGLKNKPPGGGAAA
jgi:hypothetical protein